MPTCRLLNVLDRLKIGRSRNFFWQKTSEDFLAFDKSRDRPKLPLFSRLEFPLFLENFRANYSIKSGIGNDYSTNNACNFPRSAIALFPKIF